MAKRITKLHKDVTTQIEKMNQAYKTQADKHQRFKEFKEGDLVMIHLRKARLPAGKYSKIQPKKIGPYPIIKRFGDNAYKIDLPDHTHQSYLQCGGYIRVFPSRPATSFNLKLKDEFALLKGEECDVLCSLCSLCC